MIDLDEKERIKLNDIKKRMLDDGETFSSEEVSFLVKCERQFAIKADERKQKADLDRQIAEVQIEEMRKTEKAARDNLEALKDAALARYERLEKYGK